MDIIAELETLRREYHRDAVDGFYSCPKAENYFGSAARNLCHCGKDQTDKVLDKVIAELRRLGITRLAPRLK